MRIRLFSLLFLVPMICLLCIGFCISAVSGQCLGDQQSLLLQLKNSLVFDIASSTKLVHWNQSVDCCLWEGVSCDEGRVIGLDLTNKSLSGGLDHSSSLFKLQSLQNLRMAYNNFSSEIPSQFDKLTNLSYLNLSNAGFTGQIPIAISHLTRLVTLDLSTYYCYGEISPLKLENPNLKMLVQNLSELMELHLDYVNISAQGYEWGTALSPSLPKLTVLSLTNCLLSGPLDSLQFNVSMTMGNLLDLNLSHFLINQFTLSSIDLSNNEIHGEIPNWIWKLPYLQSLNLSYNHLETLDLSLLNMSSLSSLDLHSNQLQGQLLVFPKHAQYLDFSRNNFSSVIPANIGNFLTYMYFFSLSHNKLYGSIPRSICNTEKLIVLDLSDNFLSGTIPPCLFDMNEAQGLGVLNLRRNYLTGTISNAFPSNCRLQTLSLNGNQLEGKLPKSLANCTSLEVLNLGHNHIEDAFPCYLKNIFMLHILILRSNKFYGPIDCQGLNASWPKLQIVDLAANNFSGKLPIKYFSNLKAIRDNKIEVEYMPNNLQFGQHVDPPKNTRLYKNTFVHWDDRVHRTKARQSIDIRVYMIVIDVYYQDVITVTMKGQEAKLVRILNIFTSLDFSCNKFDGSIPGEIGELKSLYILNLSHNAFTGQIPPSLGKLSQLESLDLSNNKLIGKIPVQLANGLIFLSVLNLSFNQLVGKIPQIKQFATFLETSYEGNIGLCGLPLREKCTDEESGSSPTASEETHSNSRNAIDWNFLSVELGFVFGFGIVIWPLMFWKRWRINYYKLVDDIFFKMFPKLYIRIGNYRRRAHKSQGRRVHKNQGRRH